MKNNTITQKIIQKMGRLLYIIFLLFIFLATVSNSSCKIHKIKDGDPDNDTFASVANEQKVSVIRLMPSDFLKEITSNGKLAALNKADMRFRTSENISKIYVRNSDRVKKGDILAELDNTTLKFNLEQSRDSYDKSILEFQDILIGLGYSIADTANVPDTMLRNAKVKSGLNKAKDDLKMMEYNLNMSVLRAPYPGIIANLFGREKNFIKQDEVFCTVIDDESIEAEFTLLESELPLVHISQHVKVIPYSSPNDEYFGEVTKINPVVDQNGVVKIDALIHNNNGRLFEGMNVKVFLGDKMPDQLVIPKSALVLRSGRQVVFTYKTGKAQWVYVQSSLENSSSVIITDGLHIGDSVIYDGNLNLAHDSRVIL